MPRVPGVPLTGWSEVLQSEMQRRVTEMAHDMSRRRSVRDFSRRGVPRTIIEDCLRVAGSAPSGANRQPWHFVAVSAPEVKRRIRVAAEAEEREFYSRRASQRWLDALAPIGTDARKPFLEHAPWLIAVFEERFGTGPEGERVPNYYPTESVGLATGMLITAIHRAGLVSLTHTPSPMAFLTDILGRPSSERPFLLLVVGYPADGATVPELRRKPLEEIATFIGEDPGEP